MTEVGSRHVRLSHLPALAVLAALVAAMFAVTVSGRAANKIIFDDSDAVVKAGTDVQVKLVASNSVAAFGTAQALEVNRWHVSGAGELVFESTAGTIAPTTGTSRGAQKIVTTGAPAGKYTVTATVGEGAAAVSYTNELTIGEPGEAIATAELTFNKHHTPTNGTFACGAADPPQTSGSPTDDEKAEKASEATDTDTATAGSGETSGICMVLNVTNSLGNKPLDTSVTRITVITPGASNNEAGASDTQVFDEDSTPSAGATTAFRVQKDKSGTVDVYAIVFGAGGAVATSNTITLKFSGGPDAIEIGDEIGSLLAPAAAGAANSGLAYFEVTATDKSGSSTSAAGGAGATNNLTLDAADIAVKITDDEGANVTTKFGISYAVRASADVDSTAVDETKISRNALAVVIEPGLPSGVAGDDYTVEVTLNIGSKNKAEATLNVVGPLDKIEVSADKETVVVGDTVVVTAKLTDANGLPVADGKAPVAASGTDEDAVPAEANDGDNVVFTSAGSLKLVGFGADANGQVTQEVKNGEASATFVVTQGSGSATVLVNVQSPRKTGTVSVGTEAADAMPEEEASVGCLSNLAGFATWACGVESSASEIFGLVSGRGATALHLWNGSAWVRYSVVDGTMVPGSSDFMVAENDILYISN